MENKNVSEKELVCGTFLHGIYLVTSAVVTCCGLKLIKDVAVEAIRSTSEDDEKKKVN